MLKKGLYRRSVGGCPKLKTRKDGYTRYSVKNNLSTPNVASIEASIENEKSILGRSGGGRDNQYDLLRILSCFCVILIHVNWFFFCGRYSSNLQDNLYVTEALINIATRFSVPAFVMISGAYNLKKEVAISFYIRTSYKIILPTMTATIFMVLLKIIKCICLEESFKPVFHSIVSGGFNNLWFISMLLGLYFLTPLIVIIKNSITRRQYIVLTLILLLWSVVSSISFSTKLSYGIGVVASFVSYYILGDILYGLVKSCNLENRRRLRFISIVVSLICIAVTFFVRSKGFYHYIYEPFTNFFSPTIMIYSICIFLFVGSTNIKTNYSWISTKTFYIYIFHTMVLNALLMILRPFYTTHQEILSIVVIWICTVMISLIIGVIFSICWTKVCNLFSLENKWGKLSIWNYLKR